MVWFVLTMILSSATLIVLHLQRRSRRTWTAVVALVLAVLTFLTGFSIGPLVAPLAIVALVGAALAVPSTRRVA